MIEILEKIATQHGLRRHANRWAGPCPECGGQKTSDRFSLRDDGGFRCFACGFKGDFISWFRKREGMSCPEAHQAANKVCSLFSCPARSKCRMGDGQGGGTMNRRRSMPLQRKQKCGISESSITQPSEDWSEWAERLIKHGEEAINENQQVCTWLQVRGIDDKARSLFRLGFNSAAHSLPRINIGLPPRDDGKKTLWVPDGLIIPIISLAEKPHRIRIRRPMASREKLLPKLKYIWIEGSGTGPMVIGAATGTSRGVVVVEAELDAIAVAAAHPQVTVIAMGTVSAGLPANLREELAKAPVILVAFDADPIKNGKKGPGAEAVEKWRQSFRRAVYWPVPDGKDPGEYVKDYNGNLAEWIEDGLPSVVAAPPREQDDSLIPHCVPLKAGGEKKQEEATAHPSIQYLDELLHECPVFVVNTKKYFGLEKRAEFNRKLHWQAFTQISKMIFNDPIINAYLTGHPAKMIDVGNLGEIN